MADSLAISPSMAARMLSAAGVNDIDSALASLSPAARFDGCPYYDARAVSRLGARLTGKARRRRA
jgi:hypothetical protein